MVHSAKNYTSGELESVFKKNKKICFNPLKLLAMNCEECLFEKDCIAECKNSNTKTKKKEQKKEEKIVEKKIEVKPEKQEKKEEKKYEKQSNKVSTVKTKKFIIEIEE